jgi:hypothetical protein
MNEKDLSTKGGKQNDGDNKHQKGEWGRGRRRRGKLRQMSESEGGNGGTSGDEERGKTKGRRALS